MSAHGRLPPTIEGRYEPREHIQSGGMGAVWRVRDTHLERDVAMKVMLAERFDSDQSARMLGRFQREARLVAQLAHPSIVPVHDLGQLPDGRPWFTMRIIEGETFEQLNQQAHAAWRKGEADGHFSRLMEQFVRAVEAVAYAHTHHIVHRDLKPANMMAGPFGAIYVVDWGLANLQEAMRPEHAGDPRLTLAGTINGTPHYLSPEQARGEARHATARTDVYALGASLYELLTARPPRIRRSLSALLEAIAQGEPVPPPSKRSEGGPAIDDDLDRICMRALETDPQDRYPEAQAMAADLRSWIDGSARRARASALVAQAEQRLADGTRAQAEASRWAEEAERSHAAVAAYADATHKREAWACEDRSRAAAAEARRARTAGIGDLRAALAHEPSWEPAHRRLAQVFHEQHRAHEQAGRHDEAEAVEADLRAHDRTGSYAAYLTGTGALTIHTDVPAEVRLHELVEVERRLTPRFLRSLGPTPIERVALPMGRYVATLHRPGFADVTYPVWIRRQEHWDGVAPGDSEATVIWMPPDGALRADECYVPAGWFWAGDDTFSHRLPLQRAWVDGFVMDRFPVTVEQYLAFLNALVGAGEEATAELVEPRLTDSDEPFFERDGRGQYLGVRTDKTDDPDWDILRSSRRLPIFSVDWPSAQTYADWAGRHLPLELQWQKAARGVDGRRYPWGDHFEPSWCRMATSTPTGMLVPVDDYPGDVSVYGVRGMAGNITDWVADEGPDPGQRFTMGGSCGDGARSCESAQRNVFSDATRLIGTGFRTCRVAPVVGE